VNNFGNYDRTYGSLGAVVGFMTWIWLTLTVVLAGAELNCELERQVSPGSRATAGH
jgi:membrane protein